MILVYFIILKLSKALENVIFFFLLMIFNKKQKNYAPLLHALGFITVAEDDIGSAYLYCAHHTNCKLMKATKCLIVPCLSVFFLNVPLLRAEKGSFTVAVWWNSSASAMGS